MSIWLLGTFSWKERVVAVEDGVADAEVDGGRGCGDVIRGEVGDPVHLVTPHGGMGGGLALPRVLKEHPLDLRLDGCSGFIKTLFSVKFLKFANFSILRVWNVRFGHPPLFMKNPLNLILKLSGKCFHRTVTLFPSLINTCETWRLSTVTAVEAPILPIACSFTPRHHATTSKSH